MSLFKLLMILLLVGPLWSFISGTARLVGGVLATLVWLLIARRSRRRWKYHVGGSVTKGFERVEQVFRQNVESGDEQGAAFAVYHKGQLVVDLWGGYADHRARRLRQRDTTCVFYSSTKAVAAIVLALLVDRGQLNYEAPVSDYWPEFAANGKKGIKLNTLLSHRAGLLTIKQRHKVTLLRDDPEKLGTFLAQQEPLWTPDTRVGYHALTYGLYADQLVRKVDKDKRSLAQFFEDEIAKPYDIEFRIGEPKEWYWRSARENIAIFGWKFALTIFLPHMFSFCWRTLRSLVLYRTMYLLHFIGSPVDFKFRYFNDPNFRQLECPASHGVGTARGLSKLMSIVANDGCHDDGRRLLTSETVAKLGQPISDDDYDVVVMKRISYGPGMVILPVEQGTPREHTIFGHWGAGGQMAFCDTRYKLGWAYGTNYANIIHGSAIDHRYQALQNALYECIQQLDTK